MPAKPPPRPEPPPPRVDRDSPPRPPLGATPRQASSDDLGTLEQLDAAEGRARAALAELERERRERVEERARFSAVGFPPAVIPGPAPSTVEPETAAERALEKGSRFGQRAAYILGAVLGMGGMAGAGVLGGQVALNPKPAKEANLSDTDKRVKLVEKWRDDVEPWQRSDYTDRARKEALVLDFLCQQGFRPDGLKCEEVRDRVKQLRKDEVSNWPDPRLPPRKPDPEKPLP